MLCVILALSACMFMLSLGAVSSAKASTDGFAIVNKAEVRLPDVEGEDTTGIRFTATLDKTKFESVTDGVSSPVYFGIEITANGVSRDIVYLVDDASKTASTAREIDFGADSTYTYTASITYTSDILRRDLALDARFNKNYDETKSDAENIAAFDESVLVSYLRAAYKTELTAKAFYRVGDEGEKVYGEGSTTRSMWGVATAAYLDDSTEYSILAEKYFTAGATASANIVYETGAFDYTVNDTDKVYVNAQLVSVVDGKISASVFADKAIGDTLTVAVISEDGALTTVTATIKSQNVVIDTQAYYDSAKDIIYFNDMKDTIQGSKDATFTYVVDAETSYALGSYTEDTFTSNVNYKYADSVHFNTDTDRTATANKTSFGYLMDALQPKIKHADGTVVATIPYNPQTDEYTGVTVTVKQGDTTYKFTDTIITSEMIDDATELDRIFNQPERNADSSTKGYVLRGTYITKYGGIAKGVYMLAKDIDCSTGFTFDNSYWNYFEGVLDGRGFSIKNLDVSGTEAKPSNGLFSATSVYTAIQNIAFINVTANYGSVFQGNQFDKVGSVANATLFQTYYMHDGTTDTVESATANGEGLGSIYYRRQLVDSSDTTTTIGELLKSGARGGYSHIGQGGYFSNVYVQVNPNTKRLMGVISRHMKNSVNTVRAYNMVIEYLPDTDKLYDSAEGANDGALPYNYSYTQGQYGVLFGAAYEYNHANHTREYNFEETHFDKNQDGTFKNITFYTPNSTVVSTNRHFKTEGALLFHDLTNCYHQGRVDHSTKVYVVSPLGLVSSAQGSILGTNEEVTADNPYKFVSNTSCLWLATSGVDTRLERYDDYTKAVVSGKTTNNQLTSYINDGGAELNYWDISKGYLDWKNA